MRIRPSIGISSLPRAGGYARRFAMAAAAGFEGVEVAAGPGDVVAIGDAAAAAGLVVPTTYSNSYWTHPLSSGDAATRAAGIEAAVGAVQAAHALGADSVLLVPGLVDRETSYSDAYARSQAVIRSEILPVARDLGVVLGIENVWNGMLLGPLEYVRYIDEFDSPWVKAHLDLGNVIFGQCEDWIDIAGARIVKLHLKDCEFSIRWGRYRQRRLGEGKFDWARIRAALERVGFSGWATVASPERTRRLTHIVYYAAERAPPRLLSSLPGSRTTLDAVERHVGRRMLSDAIDRFRHHVA